MKRKQVLLVRNTVVKPTSIINDVSNNPWSGTSANNQEQLILAAPPAIPEEVQSFDKAGFRCRETWEFVNEYHHPFSFDSLRDQKHTECFECRHPSTRLTPLVTILFKGSMECGEFFTFCSFDDSRCRESELLIIQRIDEVGFADSSTTVYCDEFWLSWRIETLKIPYFCLATYNLFHIFFLICKYSNNARYRAKINDII